MDVPVACKNEEDPIKNVGAREVITLIIDFFRCSWAANSKVSDGIFPKFKLIQTFMVLLPVRMKKIHPKMKALEWSQHFSNYKSKGIYARRSRAANS